MSYRKGGEVSYEVKRMIGGIAPRTDSGWRKEINVVSWNGNEAKYDIRDWDETHERMSRGIALKASEAKALYELLKKEFEEA